MEEIGRTNVMAQPTFADALKKQPISESEQTIEKVASNEKPALYVKPDKGQTMAQLRSGWLEVINPEKDEVRVTLFTEKTIIIVQAETRDNINKIINKEGI